ncbi:unnamed protein product [Mytilus coruscus]|uniref:CCHC-type domain-containing protein n=1 Tax=Mytilus coruscus TaxID=42192 RepID=A0A6J8C9U2_MYTCO|nr:unnamed protein product [Mytilus coruscus]
MPGERGANRTVKEQTVLFDVGDNKNVSALSVINSVEAEVGEGVVEACVPKCGNVYEITLKELETVDLLCDTGFKVNNVKFKPNAVFSKQKMVSFLNVSYYVTDEEITKKLEDFGAELISPIKRRMHPGTTIADGTRYVVVRFPEYRQSLPYSMKFSTGVNSYEYIRVLHDNQKRVCSKCFESGHVYINCPDNMCYRCKDSGHLARNCPKPRCDKCQRYPASYELNLDENPNTDSSNNTPDDDDEQTEVMTVHEHSKDNLIDNEINILHKKGGSKKVNESVSHESNVDMVDCDHDKNVESSIASESEMEITDEELARSMGKKRRRRLVTSPNLTPEDIKKMKSNPKSKLSLINQVQVHRYTPLLFIFLLMVNIVSINANGLRDVTKFQNFTKYCSENYFDIVGIQETFWDDGIIPNIEKILGRKNIFCNGVNLRQGVAF